MLLVSVGPALLVGGKWCPEDSYGCIPGAFSECEGWGGPEVGEDDGPPFPPVDPPPAGDLVFSPPITGPI